MEKRREIFSKIAYGCFYLGVVIEVLLVLIDKSAFVNPIEGRVFQITFLLFTVKAVLTKYSFREYVVAALFLMLGAISYFVTGRNEIIRFVMFIAACKDVDMKKCLKLIFYLTFAGCALLIFLSLSGVFGATSITMDYGRGEVEKRYTLGLGHPNSLQCMVWALTVLFLYLYGERMKWYAYVLLLAVNGFFFLLTSSKTSLMVAYFSILYTLVICFFKKDTIRKVCCVTGGILSAFGIIISVLIASQAWQVYNYYWSLDGTKYTELFVKLDRILTGRIHSLVGTVRWEGTVRTWSLFSEPANNYYFDMGWIRLFYWYGVIPAVVFIILMFLLMVYCTKQRNYMAVMLLTSFAVYSIIEAHAVSVYLARNYVLFIFGMYWCELIDIRKSGG